MYRSFFKKNINKAVKNEATAWLNDFIFILYTGESPFVDKMILTEIEKGITKGNEMKRDIFRKNWFARSQKNAGDIKRTMKKIAALTYQIPKRIKSIIVGSNLTFVRTFSKNFDWKGEFTTHFDEKHKMGIDGSRQRRTSTNWWLFWTNCTCSIFLGERSEAFSHKDTSKWFRFLFPSLTSLCVSSL